MSTKYDEIDWQKIWVEREKAPKGEKGIIVLKYAEMFKVSKHTIFRELKNRFVRKKIIFKENKIDQKIIDEIYKIKVTAKENFEKIPSTRECIRKLIEMGINGSKELKTSTVNRRLAKMNFKVSNYEKELRRDKNRRSRLQRIENEIKYQIKDIYQKLVSIKNDELYLLDNYTNFNDYVSKKISEEKIKIEVNI